MEITEAKALVRNAESKIQAVFQEQMRVLNAAGLVVSSIDVRLLDAATYNNPPATAGSVRIKVTL